MALETRMKIADRNPRIKILFTISESDEYKQYAGRCSHSQDGQICFELCAHIRDSKNITPVECSVCHKEILMCDVGYKNSFKIDGKREYEYRCRCCFLRVSS